MNQLKIFVIIICSVMVQSCCQMLHLKKRDLGLVNPYNLNDTFIFKSDKNNTDTLKIVRKDFTKPKDSGDCNWSVAFYLAESVQIDYQFYHGGKWSDTLNFMYLERVTRTQFNNLILRVFQLEYARPNVIKEDTYLSSQNKQIMNSFVFTKDRAYVLDSKIGIEKFYWSVSMGLIKYISKDGETWELQPTSKNNKG